jgi:hypothetical protein
VTEPSDRATFGVVGVEQLGDDAPLRTEASFLARFTESSMPVFAPSSPSRGGEGVRGISGEEHAARREAVRDQRAEHPTSRGDELDVEIGATDRLDDRYPMLARVVRDATHPSPDAVFEEGLECVLDGIAARVERG